MTDYQKSLQAEYNKQRRRIMQTVRRAANRGYDFIKAPLPPKPKRITEASIRRLQAVTPGVIYGKATYRLTPSAGLPSGSTSEPDVISGTEARAYERRAAARAAAETRARIKAGLEPPCVHKTRRPPDHTRYRERITEEARRERKKQKPTQAPGLAAGKPEQSKQPGKGGVKGGNNHSGRPKGAKDKQPRKKRTDKPEGGKGGNNRKGRPKGSKDKQPRKRKTPRISAPDPDVIIENTINFFKDPGILNKVEADIAISYLMEAVMTDGAEDVARRIEGSNGWGDIIGAIGYDSDSGEVSFCMSRYVEILFGRKMSVEESQDLNDRMESTIDVYGEDGEPF